MAYFSEEEHAHVDKLDLVAVAILYEADDKIRETYNRPDIKGLNKPSVDDPLELREPNEPRGPFSQYTRPPTHLDQATDRCVAVAQVGDELYVGTNGLSITKELRDSVRGKGKKDNLSGTMVKNINAGHAISKDLLELNKFRQEIADGLGQILGFTRLHFIVGTATYLNNYHAEMQILDWFITNNITPNSRFIGVSKPCCPECTAVLAKAGIKHSSSHSKNAHVRRNVEDHVVQQSASFGGQSLHPHLDDAKLANFNRKITRHI